MRGVTIKRVIKIGGRVTCNFVYRYSNKNEDSLKKFANFFYQERKKSKTSAMKACFKLAMNSLIGRFSMAQKSAYTLTA